MSDKPLRVASVLQSATEMLCFIGGADLLVGRSHDDNYPEDILHLPILTSQLTSFTTAVDVDRQISEALSTGQSLYSLDESQFLKLQPDVILTQDICSVCSIDLSTMELLAAKLHPSPRVVSLNPLNIEDVLQNLTQLGEAVGLQAKAGVALAGLKARLAAADARVALHTQAMHKRANVAFIEWPEPLYVGGHWTPQLIERAGGCHPLNPGNGTIGAGKSFAVAPSKLVNSDPDLIIVCCCGLDLDTTKRELSSLQQNEWWSSLRAVQDGRVVVVDGDHMFNRPGPRLVDAFEWLCSVLLDQQELAPQGFPSIWLPPLIPGEQVLPSKRAREIPDIEEIHALAVKQGQKQYIDPGTGYTVFSQLFMIERGWCCGSGCRHCPFGHQNLPTERKCKVKPPIIVAGFGCPRKSLPKPSHAL